MNISACIINSFYIVLGKKINTGLRILMFRLHVQWLIKGFYKHSKMKLCSCDIPIKDPFVLGLKSIYIVMDEDLSDSMLIMQFVSNNILCLVLGCIFL